MPAPTDAGTQRWVLVLTSAASLLVALDALVVATALTAIGQAFGAAIEALEWTVNAYTLTFAVLLMPAAALGDRYGRRRMFVAGLLLFTAASAACALSTGIGWLIAARAVQGAGAAAVLPLALAQISAAFAPERRGWALGIYSSVTAFSSILGPLVGGALTQGLAWPWIFWLNLPLGLVGAVLARRRLPETRGPTAPLDIPGLALVSGGALALVWGLVRANSAGWTSTETLSALGGGVLLMAAFAAWESCAAAPMVPLRLFRLRAFAAGNLAIGLQLAGMMAAIFFLAQFQQAVLGQGPLGAGLRLLPWGITLVAGAPKAGALAQRLGEAPAVALGLFVQALGLAWLALVARPDVGYGETVLPMIMMGAGFALSIPTVQKAVVGAVQPAEIGKASGVLGMIRQLGATFGVALTVAAFAALGSRSDPAAFCAGFRGAMAVAAVLSLGGAAAGLWLPGRPRTAVVPAGMMAAKGGTGAGA